MSWLTEFPTMDDTSLTALKKAIDEGFRAFTRAYGYSIENAFHPLQTFLIWSEHTLVDTAWPLVLLGLLAVVYAASRSWKIVAGSAVALVLIGYFGMWEDTMKTISMIFVATVVSIVVGIPIGIAMSRLPKVRAVVNPVLDVMQTMPSFVYLIPVVMLLGIGKVPGLIAVVIYAIPPVIRFTDLGIRLVDPEVLEAADAFGSDPGQRLAYVQLPLALPTIMAGVNQTIMMALAMVVVASMIGVQGLGQPVLKAIANQYFTLGLFNGFAIAGIAIIFDRATQAFGRRLQKHQEVAHGH
ncbi:Glycine betaine transport system permease protein OpuAB [Hartmannibacter diazotrophicus]|uniref:Glycine betaine transport system permease protein OpuAB n=1 Tax=Hartmannibacter diazotrophicus TaxID=1482074 RepID=A0A2C9DCQ3_9HYPH|nr:proline/glycine betaine ABC transporter permease [Hartmannibacter diazotrophicus]SON58023.1 Glycine betaine transport system permease protein OpuAB [Hartmannibacter diazotrophicus]SON58077.1 Glycine betaine transport system permease protein OpuAB [Hartmannibacter diazotrophicus]